MHPSYIEIDLDQLDRNLSAIRRRIGPRLLCFPVKANAYGHGLVPIALAAQEMGVDQLAVSCLAEGVTLRKAGVHRPVLVLGAIHEAQIDDLVAYDLEFSISSRFKSQLVMQKGKRCRVHLEVDTGMNRTGMRPETALRLLEELSSQDILQVVGIYSHLATADAPKDATAAMQIRAFAALREQIRGNHLIWHLANSGGVYFYPESYFDMVRPGLLAYGLLPDGSQESEIRPIFSLKARLSYFKVVAEGQGISYGHLYRTAKQTRIVTVPIGYGDGYPSALAKLATVLIRGKKYQIAGRICMDQFMVDIGDDEAYVGDEVTLVDPQSIGSIARTVGVDPRELLCRFNDRIPRIYNRKSSPK